MIWLRLITWRADDMPGHIESKFDDCDCASDASSVLRRASKNEAGWLARFALKRVEQQREAFELGLECDLQAISASLPSCHLSLTQRLLQSCVSTTRSAELPRAADAGCPQDVRVTRRLGQAHRVGSAQHSRRRRLRPDSSANDAFCRMQLQYYSGQGPGRTTGY